MHKPRRNPVVREDGTIEIPLVHGHVAIIDWVDVWVLHLKWNASIEPDGRVYAVSMTEKREYVRLHRHILRLKKGDPRFGDHINGDCLNNRRSNLRIVTVTENARNAKPYKNNTSGYRGVFWHKREKKWRARLKRKDLGAYNTPEEANAARLKAEFEEWGIHPQRSYAFSNFDKANS